MGCTTSSIQIHYDPFSKSKTGPTIGSGPAGASVKGSTTVVPVQSKTSIDRKDEVLEQLAKEFKLPTTDLRALKSLFVQLDADQNNFVDQEEFNRFIKEQSNPFVDLSFLAIDPERSHKLTFRYFVKLLTSFCVMADIELLKFAFEAFDADHNGFIETTELADLLDAVEAYNYDPRSQHGSERLSLVHQAPQILEEVDADGDERINFSEFQTLHSRFPNLLRPLFRLQQRMQHFCMGEDWWKQQRDYIRAVQCAALAENPGSGMFGSTGPITSVTPGRTYYDEADLYSNDRYAETSGSSQPTRSTGSTLTAASATPPSSSLRTSTSYTQQRRASLQHNGQYSNGYHGSHLTRPGASTWDDSDDDVDTSPGTTPRSDLGDSIAFHKLNGRTGSNTSLSSSNSGLGGLGGLLGTSSGGLLSSSASTSVNAPGIASNNNSGSPNVLSTPSSTKNNTLFDVESVDSNRTYKAIRAPSASLRHAGSGRALTGTNGDNSNSSGSDPGAPASASTNTDISSYSDATTSGYGYNQSHKNRTDEGDSLDVFKKTHRSGSWSSGVEQPPLISGRGGGVIGMGLGLSGVQNSGSFSGRRHVSARNLNSDDGGNNDGSSALLGSAGSSIMAGSSALAASVVSPSVVAGLSVSASLANSSSSTSINSPTAVTGGASSTSSASGGTSASPSTSSGGGLGSGTPNTPAPGNTGSIAELKKKSILRMRQKDADALLEFAARLNAATNVAAQMEQQQQQ